MYISSRADEILGRFCDNIRDDPDADFTPFIRRFAAYLRGLERKSEQDVVYGLFSRLYCLGRNGYPLRRDLCKFVSGLETLREGETVASAKQRQKLLQALYVSLSFYAGKERSLYSLLAEKAPGQPKLTGDYKAVLSNIKDEVRQSRSYIKLSSYKELIEAEYQEASENRKTGVVTALLQSLYRSDISPLKVEETKISFRGPVKIQPSECAELLPILYGALASYIGEDFSPLFARCDLYEDIYRKMER